MRQPIETAPKDGRAIWVEDDHEAFDVAQWSSETSRWVWKSGEAIRITPKYWTSLATSEDQDEEQTDSPLRYGHERRWFTASLIASTVVVTALIGVYCRSEVIGFATDLLVIDDTGSVGDRTQLVRASATEMRAAAGGSQSFRRGEATATLMPDADTMDGSVRASTTQYRQALEQEISFSDALAVQLAEARSEIDTKAALADKAVQEAAQLKQAADAATSELQKSLHQERDRSVALTSELAKVRADLETTVALSARSYDEAVQRSQLVEVAGEELRKSLQKEGDRAAALASELAGTRREIETQAAQSQKANDAATKQRQAAEGTITELRQTLEQEQKKTAALIQEANAAQAKTPAAEQQRRALEEAQARAAGVIPAVRSADGQVARVTHLEKNAAAEPPKAIEAQRNAEAAKLIARAIALLGQGNIGAARTVLERAAENGNAKASFMLAETYDPAMLSAWGTWGTRGEVVKAREHYAKAYGGGIREAKERLDALRQ